MIVIKCTIFFASMLYYFNKDRQNLRLIAEIWICITANILNAQLFFSLCGNMFFFKLKISKIQYFLLLIIEMSLLHEILLRWYFLKAQFFCINTLLFYQKLAKFMTDCQNMNFPNGEYFYKCTHSNEIWQNSQQTDKMRTFLVAVFIWKNTIILCIIISPKIGKIHD